MVYNSPREAINFAICWLHLNGCWQWPTLHPEDDYNISFCGWILSSWAGARQRSLKLLRWDRCPCTAPLRLLLLTSSCVVRVVQIVVTRRFVVIFRFCLLELLVGGQERVVDDTLVNCLDEIKLAGLLEIGLGDPRDVVRGSTVNGGQPVVTQNVLQVRSKVGLTVLLKTATLHSTQTGE